MLRKISWKERYAERVDVRAEDDTIAADWDELDSSQQQWEEWRVLVYVAFGQSVATLRQVKPKK